MRENVDRDQINRLWDYRLHLEDIYYSRHNFLLVFESVLLGVVGVLFSRTNPQILVLKIIAILGLSLTIVWGYTQAWQLHVIDDLRNYLKEVVPEYRATWERRNIARWPIRTMHLLTFVIPTLVALVWLVFLFFF